MTNDNLRRSTVVYKATNIYGEVCHFGFLPLAKAWAKSGCIEEIAIMDEEDQPRKTRRVSYVCHVCGASMIRSEHE